MQDCKALQMELKSVYLQPCTSLLVPRLHFSSLVLLRSC